MPSRLTNYAFLEHSWKIEDYIPAEYYDRILKNYDFAGQSDLQILAAAAAEFNWPDCAKVLELGCGTGRATQVVLDARPGQSIDVLDLSPQMLAAAVARHGAHALRPIQSDAVDFMASVGEAYDFVYSLWSFSHSVHQHIIEDRAAYVRSTVKSFLSNRLSSGGRFFLIHFDILSEEQRLTIPLWNRIHKDILRDNTQSQSLLLLQEVFEDLARDGVINFSLKHLIGDEVVFESITEAVEIYMNFHLEAQFNQLPREEIEQVIEHVAVSLQPHLRADGSVAVKPGCFVAALDRL